MYLEITVDNVILVKIFHCLHELCYELTGVLLWVRLQLYNLVEEFSSSYTWEVRKNIMGVDDRDEMR